MLQSPLNPTQQPVIRCTRMVSHIVEWAGQTLTEEEEEEEEEEQQQQKEQISQQEACLATGRILFIFSMRCFVPEA